MYVYNNAEHIFRLKFQKKIYKKYVLMDYVVEGAELFIFLFLHIYQENDSRSDF